MKEPLIVTRTFNAPVEAVWQTWVNPELVKRWWGPARFTCPRADIDFREGGTSLVAMQAPAEMGGQRWFSIWVYTKIVPLQSIEFIQSLADEAGNTMDPTQVGMPADFPKEIRTEVIFKALAENQTQMTVTEYADMGQTAEFARMGLEQSLDKMGEIFI